MKTKTVYLCDHCEASFDAPCEAHEIECGKEKQRLVLRAKAEARFEPLCNVLLGEKTEDPIGAKINGSIFLISTPISKKDIRSLCNATALVSAELNPCERDRSMINRANQILAT